MLNSYMLVLGSSEELADIAAWALDHAKNALTGRWLHHIMQLEADADSYPRFLPVPPQIGTDLQQLVVDWAEVCEAQHEEMNSHVARSDDVQVPELQALQQADAAARAEVKGLLESLSLKLQNMHAGSAVRGRWLDSSGTECSEGDPGARWEEYDLEEQAQWLGTVAGAATAAAALCDRLRELVVPADEAADDDEVPATPAARP